MQVLQTLFSKFGVGLNMENFVCADFVFKVFLWTQFIKKTFFERTDKQTRQRFSDYDSGSLKFTKRAWRPT